MLIFPVTCRFGAGARLTLELIMGPIRAESHPRFVASLRRYLTFFSPSSGRIPPILGPFSKSI